MKKPILELQGVTKRFGGIAANDDINILSYEGDITGLLGPNGSGKSTLFDIIAGATKPDRGTILFDGRNITGLKPYAVGRAGIGRTFQKLRPFQDMSALENVMVGALQRTRVVREARAQALDCLAKVGLERERDVKAGALSTGGRKRLEVARALATNPKLLLLDEVLAGVDDEGVSSIMGTIRSLRDDGVSILIVEHNIGQIAALCDRVVVLDLGRVIAEGTPAQIRADRRVIQAYLGTGYA